MKYSESDFIPYAAETAMPSARALVLAPHPDDEVFGCGGAIMRHVAAGDPIRVVIVTDGALGLPVGTPDAALIRQHESACAAAILGYGEPIFWGLPDRGLEYGEELIQRILHELEDVGAELVYASSWWEIHPDHLTLALATAEAVRRCPRPVRLVMYEVGVPLHPNRLLNITDLRERKQAAMGCFASQLTQQSYDRHVAALNTFRTYTLPADVDSAEAYRLVERDELRQDPLRCIRPDHHDSQALSRVAALPPLSCVVALGIDIRWLMDALDPQAGPNLQERERVPPLALESEVESLQATLTQLLRQIEEIHESTSWRSTAPLRWLVSHARRIFRSH